MQTCVGESVLVSVTCIYVSNLVSAKPLFLCQHCLCLCVSLCFILPPGVQCSLAILKVRDDTVGEGSVITATSPSFLSCILVPLFCGSWYVDVIKFSSGWVMEKTGGDEGSHPLFAAFICLSSFIPARGLWL